ncbi:MAG: hypothetical protein AAGE01_07280 [Pseudomonadota bacterium]
MTEWIHQNKEQVLSTLGYLILGYVLGRYVILGIETPGVLGAALKVLCLVAFVAMAGVSVSKTIRARRLQVVSAKAHREFQDQVRQLELEAKAKPSNGPATGGATARSGCERPPVDAPAARS